MDYSLSLFSCCCFYRIWHRWVLIGYIYLRRDIIGWRPFFSAGNRLINNDQQNYHCYVYQGDVYEIFKVEIIFHCQKYFKILQLMRSSGIVDNSNASWKLLIAYILDSPVLTHITIYMDACLYSCKWRGFAWFNMCIYLLCIDAND